MPKASKRFPEDLLTILHQRKGLRIRAGNGKHRFIGIWMVVVEDRVFVRSWEAKPNGWYRTFLKEPEGAILIPDYEVAVRAVPVKSERLNAAIDCAYLEKYSGPGSIKYAIGLGKPKCRATTMELLPVVSL